MPQERIIGLALSHTYSYYRDILRGISRFAEGRPHWRFISLAPEVGRPAREALRQIDGIISCVGSLEWCGFLLRSRVPFINIDAVVPDLPIPRVGVDNRMIGRMAAEHFIERGLRSFGFAGDRRFLFTMEREQAFREALVASHQRLAVYHTKTRHDYVHCVVSLDRGIRAWLLSLPRPAGILTPNDLWGVELMKVCREVGLRVPEDIAVLGVDNDDLFIAVSRPALSSIIVPAIAIGQRAAALVEKLIDERKTTLAEDVLLPAGGIAVRRSTDVLAIEDADVVAALRFIRENCHRPLRVADVLKETPVSRRWLERRVFETLGITLGAEIRRTRLERAKRLLTETDLSIAEVATRSGFSDLRHIEAAFRQDSGRTPTQFRRQGAGA